MKNLLLMIAILVLWGGMAMALTVQMDMQVTSAGTENADTIRVDELSTFDFFFENDDTVAGYSTGFTIWSEDGATWDYDTAYFYRTYNEETELWDTTWSIVTAVNPSRQYPPLTYWDNGGMQVTLADTSGADGRDSIMFGGTRKDRGLYPGTLQKQVQIHFTAKNNGTICIDSAKVGPAGDFVFADVTGSTMRPTTLWTDGGLCWPAVGGTAVDGKPAVPLTFGLGQNYPNPFNPATIIHYSLARKGNVQIMIYNVLGQRVKTLVNEEQEAAEYDVVWNGDDDEGRAVASGIFFYKMITDEFVSTKKMLLMR